MKKMLLSGKVSVAFKGQLLRAFGLALALPAVCAHAQQNGSPAASVGLESGEFVCLEEQSQQNPQPAPTGAGDQSKPDAKPGEHTVDPSKQQPKRILGVMPNFRLCVVTLPLHLI